MEHNWLLYIATFACSFAITICTTPLAKKISFKLGAIDNPKKRGMHDKPMPRLGGLAIVCGFMVTMLLLFAFVPEIQTTQFAGLMAGSIIIVVTGIVDDIKGLRASLKLCLQIVAGIVAVYSGIVIDLVHWPFVADLDGFAIPFTIVWIIGVTNAVNLIDGLDGLAAGVSSIAAFSLTIMCLITGSESAVFLTGAIAGSCMGFLPRNFNPAEIFMGDCGSTFLGYILAVTSVMGAFKGYTLLSLAAAVLVLAFPIFDTLFAIVRRLIKRESILKPDRGHLHHRLIDRGFSHQKTVVILYCLSGVCGICAILISTMDYRAAIVVLLSIVTISLMLFVYRKKFVKK